MRASEFPIATLREAPAGVRGETDRLLLRGGYVARIGDGSLVTAPLGERILRRARALGDLDALGLDIVTAREPGGTAQVVTLEDGDLRLLVCDSCGDAATLASASRRRPEPVAADPETSLEIVPTPGATTMATAAEALGLPVEANIKCMAYEVDGRLVLAIVPGDRAVDETKLAAVVGGAPLARLDDEGFAGRGLSKGFLGPQDHPDATIVADHGVAARVSWGAGANLDDHHVTGLVVGRDVTVDTWADLTPARDGDPCPACDAGTLRTHRALAVARDGIVDPLAVVRATVARTADANGPVWPRPLAPFEVAIVLVTPDDPDAAKAAASLHDELEAGGASVYLDDRAERAGVKFVDADLLGAPLRATVGSRGVADGLGDLTLRHTGDTAQVALSELGEEILAGLERLP